MVFSSSVFIFAFLPIMLLGFYLLKYFHRPISAKIFLILGSLFFYAYWKLAYLAILLVSIIVNYFVATLLLEMKNAHIRAMKLYGGGYKP